ncbi:AAA family ATPase [Umezawaea endophytica]|uniref:MoxR family ATPase n=1 Tax=Umezawaea endophytica TaxID=1654476 RepID=A0A9X2VIP2_9PSEU|nr:MoxR family ATPase [Umezawaea endophytica]MCS7475778.1 MoxR family ATPase [Umezawaea endophytica]
MSAGIDSTSSTSATTPEWQVYRGTGLIADSPIEGLPKPPPWRRFTGEGTVLRPADDRGEGDRHVGRALNTPRKPNVQEIAMVNAAIHLRRPLLVTGNPGTGKSSLAYLISRELGLGPVLRWPITSRTTLKDGLYLYDAIGRVQASGGRPQGNDADIGNYIHLGPLGTALLPYDLPRVLLVDEMDKGDIDLPNDLLNVFEEGEFDVLELVRFAKKQPEVSVMTRDRGGSAVISQGVVQCREFPIVIITSNGEREFPPAFLRRCLKLHIGPPTYEQLAGMVAAHFGEAEGIDIARLINAFLDRSAELGGLAADQLLNAVSMATSGAFQADHDWNSLLKAIWHPLANPTAESP